MKLEIHIVDAFAEKPFEGNSAAVIILDEWLNDALMQSIAMENNLSETAFLVKDNQACFHIRWFSPLSEVAFCGHATLASAFVLFSQDDQLTSLRMHADAVGYMLIDRASDGFIRMDFPSRPPEPVDVVPAALLAGLSIRPDTVLRNEQAYFAVYSNEQTVRDVKPDIAQIKQLAPYDVVVTAPGKSYDCVSRYFWPANGGEEDPVTGSIHTGLVPYWAEKFGKTKLVAYQASRRGGVLRCEMAGDRVFISGKALCYLKGFIDV